MATPDQIASQVGELRGSVNAMKDHLAALDTSIKSIDEKLDQFLLKEARKEGEFNGIKKSATWIAMLVSAVVNFACWAVSSVVR